MTSLYVAAALGILLAAGFPLAFAVCRSAGLAIVFAPLASALTASAAAIVMVLAGGSFRIWLGVACCGQWLIALLLLRNKRERLPNGSGVDIVVMTGALLPPFLMVLASPRQWDAHMIWWLHAEFFLRGAEFTRSALTDPILLFSHPDYPPASSATVGGVWSMVPGQNMHVAQFVSATITFSATVLLAYAVRRMTAGAPALWSRLAGISVGLAVWALGEKTVAGGYADALWSAAFAAGVVLLLARGGLHRPALPLLLIAVAALAKNEGLVMALVVALLMTLKHRRDARTRLLFWLPAAAGLSWTLVTRWHGATSDMTGSDPLRRLTDFPSLVDRAGPIWLAIWSQVGLVLALALLTALLGQTWLRERRERLGIGSDLWLWAFLLAYFGVIAGSYLLTPMDLAWHLEFSVDRVTLLLVLLAGTSAVCWAVCATSQPLASLPDHGDLPQQRIEAKTVERSGNWPNGELTLLD